MHDAKPTMSFVVVFCKTKRGTSPPLPFLLVFPSASIFYTLG